MSAILLSYCSQSLETRKQRFAQDTVHFTEEEKLAIYKAEDIYALGILIMEVLVGPTSVLRYVTTLNEYTNNKNTFTVALPNSYGGYSTLLDGLKNDPGCF